MWQFTSSMHFSNKGKNFPYLIDRINYFVMILKTIKSSGGVGQ